MDDAARVAGLVSSQPGLGLEHADPRSGVSRGQLPGDGEPENASPDDRKVALGRRCRCLFRHLRGDGCYAQPLGPGRYGAGRTSISARFQRSAVGAVSLIETVVPAVGVGEFWPLGPEGVAARAEELVDDRLAGADGAGGRFVPVLADAPDPAAGAGGDEDADGAPLAAEPDPTAPLAAVSAPVNAATVIAPW